MTTMQEVLAKATCLYTKDQVETALDKMATDITATIGQDSPLILCVMIGALIPTAALLSRFNFALEIDYIHATRYSGRTSGHDLVWKHEPTTPLVNRTILIIDDVLDQGITLTAISEYCKHKGAKKILTAVLVEKPLSVREPETITHADFTGLQVDNHYVIGYGMDYKEYLRNVPGIYSIAKEHQ